MSIWLPDPATLSSPLHTSLATEIAKAISDGRLQKGQQLPTHRKMAEELGLSVNTISKAYDSLRRRKLIDGQIGRGSYVLDPDQAHAQPFQSGSQRQDGFDLSIARPAFSQQHVELFQETLRNLHKDLDPACFMSCRPNVGHDAHRKTGSEWLRFCGLETPAERIIMTNGASHGMSAALSALTRPGDSVVSSAITHHLLVSGCSYLGLDLVGLEMDEDGIVPDALDKHCREKSVKVLFLLPSATNPTAEMMSAQRRRDLVTIARKHDLYIIENDAGGPVAEDRPEPVAALAPERSIYLTSFTKCTISGLRAGYIAAPEHLLPALIGRLVVFGWMATPLICEIASRWVREGTALELARWQRRTLAERHEIASTVLKGQKWRGHPAALHLWLTLPTGWTTDSFVSYCRQMKVAIAPEGPFLAPKIPQQNAVRIAVASVQDPSGFRQALELVAGMLSRPPEALSSLTF